MVAPMARITVEDCLKNVDNLFDLVLIAAKRSRQLANGAEARVEWENCRNRTLSRSRISSWRIRWTWPPISARRSSAWGTDARRDARIQWITRPPSLACCPAEDEPRA